MLLERILAFGSLAISSLSIFQAILAISNQNLEDRISNIEHDEKAWNGDCNYHPQQWQHGTNAICLEKFLNHLTHTGEVEL